MNHKGFYIIPEQAVCAYFTIILTTVTLIISLVNMYYKKQIADSRGQTLVTFTMLIHILSLFIPNIFTLVCFHNKNKYFTSIGWTLLTIDNYATIIVTNLILMRALFMFYKSKDRNIVHLRGFLLTQILYITSIFWFCQFTKGYPYPTSSYLAYHYFRYIYYYSAFDYKNLTILAIFLLCIWIVRGLSQWGAYQEMVSLTVLQLTHMLALGIVKSIFNKIPAEDFEYTNHFFFWMEIISNMYRLLLMNMNCFFFIWYFDGVRSDIKLTSDLDPYKANAWNPQIKKYFKKFLKANFKLDELDFFVQNMENNNQVWIYFNNTQGN